MEAMWASMSTARPYGRCRILRRDRRQAALRPASRSQPDAASVAVSAAQPSNPLGIQTIVSRCWLLRGRRLEEERASSRLSQETEEAAAEEASSRRHRESSQWVAVAAEEGAPMHRHREKVEETATGLARPSRS